METTERKSIREVKRRKPLKRTPLKRTPLKRKPPKSATPKPKAKPVRKPKPKKRGEYKRSTYVDTLDSVFSHYVRQKFSTPDGMCECFTCGKVEHWKEIQNGHYMGRRHYATRWHVNNTRPQCGGCNGPKYGEQGRFGLNLVQEIGLYAVEEVMALSKTTVKYPNSLLLEMIAEYYSLLRWPDQISKALWDKLKQLKVI